MRNNRIGAIISRIEKEKFRIAAMKLTRATLQHAQQLYAVHAGKSFYPELIAHITSGSIVTIVLEAPDAINRMRKLIGATDPSRAEPGTIRQLYGESITRNAIHASDSLENAKNEMSIFFTDGDFVQ